MSEHFSLAEFRCHDGTEYPVEWVDDRLAKLMDTLEAIRAAWGGPLTVISGYRTEAYNERIHGARLSQHVQGRAADVRSLIYTPDVTLRLHDLALHKWERGELPFMGGLGLYPGWIHVDVRPESPGHLARWAGGGIGAEK